MKNDLLVVEITKIFQCLYIDIYLYRKNSKLNEFIIRKYNNCYI